MAFRIKKDNFDIIVNNETGLLKDKQQILLKIDIHRKKKKPTPASNRR